MLVTSLEISFLFFWTTLSIFFNRPNTHMLFVFHFTAHVLAAPMCAHLYDASESAFWTVRIFQFIKSNAKRWRRRLSFFSSFHFFIVLFSLEFCKLNCTHRNIIEWGKTHMDGRVWVLSLARKLFRLDSIHAYDFSSNFCSSTSCCYSMTAVAVLWGVCDGFPLFSRHDRTEKKIFGIVLNFANICSHSSHIWTPNMLKHVFEFSIFCSPSAIL